MSLYPILIRFHDRDGEREETFHVPFVPRRGDNLFHKGQRFEVAQVQHILEYVATFGFTGNTSATLVIATVIS